MRRTLLIKTFMSKSPAPKATSPAQSAKAAVVQMSVSELFQIAQTLGFLPIATIKKSPIEHRVAPLLSPQLIISIEDALKAAAHMYRRAAQIAKDSSLVDPYRQEEEKKRQEEAQASVKTTWANVAKQYNHPALISRSQLTNYISCKGNQPLLKHLHRFHFPTPWANEFPLCEALLIIGLIALAKRECDTNRKANERVKKMKKTKTARHGSPTTLPKLVTPYWVDTALKSICNTTDFEPSRVQEYFQKMFPRQNFPFSGQP